MEPRADAGKPYDRVALEFTNWVAGRPGISPLYEEIVGGIVSDREILKLIARLLPLNLISNRFMAAVHYLLLQGHDHPLRDYYATVVNKPSPPHGSYGRFRDFCMSNAAELIRLAKSSQVQINEVRRSAAFLLALNCRRGPTCGRPLGLVELGACAGFNLNLDRYEYDFGSGLVGAHGGLRIECKLRDNQLDRPISMPDVAFRIGIDVAPIDVRISSERNWLVAFASPDDELRQWYIQQAATVCLHHPVEIIRGSAGDIIDNAMNQVPDDLDLCILHSLTEHHFSRAERRKLWKAVLAASAVRDIDVIGLEWPRSSGAPDMCRDLELTITTCRQGKIVTRSIATSERRGGVEFLRLS